MSHRYSRTQLRLGGKAKDVEQPRSKADTHDLAVSPAEQLFLLGEDLDCCDTTADITEEDEESNTAPSRG